MNSEKGCNCGDFSLPKYKLCKCDSESKPVKIISYNDSNIKETFLK